MIDFTYLDLSFEIPANPQRVVTLEGQDDLEFAVLMGYPLIASGNSWNPGETPGAWFGEGIVKDVALLDATDWVIDLEQLATLDPDLIIMRDYQFKDDWYGNEELAMIAPILGIANGTKRISPEWRKSLIDQATLLGRTEHLGAYLAAYDEHLASARDQISGLLDGKRVQFVSAGDDLGLWPKGFPTSIASDIGMDVMFQTDGSDWVNISWEQVIQIADADLIFRFGGEERFAFMDSLETWKQLPAVKAEHVYDLSSQFVQGFSLTGTILIDRLVEAAIDFSGA
ncbi:MAG: ABC transporter substrate-binding protein [Thermomicrobiales bacterium]